MRFLVSRLSALGDVVCGLPAASALKAGHPSCEVVWVCHRRFAAIPRLCTAVDLVVELPDGFLAQREAIRRLGPFEVAIDLQGLLKSAWPVAWAVARDRISFHWQREGSRLVASPVEPDPSSIHVVDQYVDVARAAGGLADRAAFALIPREEDVSSMSRLLRERLGRDRPFVALNAGAGWATKRWELGSFVELANCLDECGYAAVFIGGRAELALYEEVRARGATKSVSFVGETGLAELVALISLSAAHVGGDTGSTHIAAALGVPAVGLYTLTHPARSGPYGQIHRTHLATDGRITVEAVFATVVEAVSPSPDGGGRAP